MAVGRTHVRLSGKYLPTISLKRESLMNTPTKAVEATSPVQNAEKTSENNETKGGAPEKKVEVTNPAPTPAK